MKYPLLTVESAMIWYLRLSAPFFSLSFVGMCPTEGLLSGDWLQSLLLPFVPGWVPDCG